MSSLCLSLCCIADWPIADSVSLGEPAPVNGWQAGHFYVVVRPAPLIEICTKISYPGLSILRPDSYEQLRLSHTVVYVGRELVDNRYKFRLALHVLV